MAYCKFCGKELGEDNKCTCAEFQDNEKRADEMIKKTSPDEDAPIKRGGAFKYIIGVLALILIITLVILIMSAAGAYKSPIKDLTKGIRQSKSELIIDSIYTENTKAELSVKAKEQGLTWEEFIKNHDKSVESAMDGAGIKRLKVDILAKEKISGSNFDKIERHYKNNYNAEAKKAYRLEVEFSYKENGIKTTSSGWICVVKLKGEGWKYCHKHSNDKFDFIENSIKFE